MATLGLNDLEIEALKEVGNIGAGHAATALSEMLDQPVAIGTPTVEIMPFAQLADRVGRHGRTISAVHMHVLGEAPCQIVVLFDHEQALDFVSIFIGQQDGSPTSELVDSTVKEVGNIIGGAYLTALTTLTGIPFIASVPTISTGSTQSAFLELLDVPADQEIFYVQTGFEKDQPMIKGEFMLIPEHTSIRPLLSVFGL